MINANATIDLMLQTVQIERFPFFCLYDNYLNNNNSF